MLEARTFVTSFDENKKILSDNGANFKGEYVIRDVVYKSHGKTLDQEFLRLRFILKNIWKEKDIILVIKNTDIKQIGKNSIIPFRKEFDNEKEARDYVST